MGIMFGRIWPTATFGGEWYPPANISYCGILETLWGTKLLFEKGKKSHGEHKVIYLPRSDSVLENGLMQNYKPTMVFDHDSDSVCKISCQNYKIGLTTASQFTCWDQISKFKSWYLTINGDPRVIKDSYGKWPIYRSFASWCSLIFPHPLDPNGYRFLGPSQPPAHFIFGVLLWGHNGQTRIRDKGLGPAHFDSQQFVSGCVWKWRFRITPKRQFQ